MSPEIQPSARVEIRDGTVDDAVDARKMQAESWVATYPNDKAGVSHEWVIDRTDTWLLDERIKESKEIVSKIIADPTQLYQIAKQDNRVVGFVHAKMQDNGTAELEAIYTSPATFGSGLGQQLMDLASDWIGGVEVSLSVASYNDRAIRFYQKNGFEIVAGSEHLYANKIPLVRMIRKGNNNEV